MVLNGIVFLVGTEQGKARGWQRWQGVAIDSVLRALVREVSEG